MLRLVFLLVILFLGKIVRAADDETWLNSDRPGNSAYFAPKVKVSTLNDRLALWPGARIGWILGSVISAGFEGYILTNDLLADNPDTSRFTMAVGGVVFEAIPSPQRRTHFVLSLLIGAGGAQVGGDPDLDTLSSRSFLVLEPAVGLELNLTPKIRLTPGLSYLWISGNVPGLDSKWKVAETAFNLTVRFKDP